MIFPFLALRFILVLYRSYYKEDGAYGFSTDIKGFMVDVKPALLSALDAEYEKNPYEVSYFFLNY